MNTHEYKEVDNNAHGRANHDPISMSPQCLCGKHGIKDALWDRYYCPDSLVWLEGLHTQCWCAECLSTQHLSEEDKIINNNINEW